MIHFGFQVSLEGSVVNGNGDTTQIPKLADYLRYFKPKRFTLKSFKSLFFVCHDLTLTAYKSAESANAMRDVAFQVKILSQIQFTSS